jgi:nitrogen-specific signal transduction histidine kinase
MADVKRFIEYNKETGKILSVLNATAERALSYENAATGVLEVPDAFQCAHNLYVVRDGRVVLEFDPNGVQDRIDRETAESAMREIRVLSMKLAEALLFDNDEEIQRLKDAAAPLKSYYATYGV